MCMFMGNWVSFISLRILYSLPCLLYSLAPLLVHCLCVHVHVHVFLPDTHYGTVQAESTMCELGNGGQAGHAGMTNEWFFFCIRKVFIGRKLWKKNDPWILGPITMNFRWNERGIRHLYKTVHPKVRWPLVFLPRQDKGSSGGVLMSCPFRVFFTFLHIQNKNFVAKMILVFSLRFTKHTYPVSLKCIYFYFPFTPN